MSKTTVRPVEEITWEALRKKATMLGVPAWRLAEELASHEKDGSLMFKATVYDIKA